MGMVDSLVKYAQYQYISNREVAFFTSVLFLISFLTGIIMIVFKRGGPGSLINLRVLLWGIMLGLVNFGSIFFLIRALNHKNVHGSGFESSAVFAINNTGIVMLSVLTGLFLFREKLNRVNRIGIVLSLIAIVVFSIASS